MVVNLVVRDKYTYPFKISEVDLHTKFHTHTYLYGNYDNRTWYFYGKKSINESETNTVGRILKFIIRKISSYYLSKQGEESDTQTTSDNSAAHEPMEQV